MAQGNQQFAKDYIDVATRIASFREKHPEGSLRPYDPAEPIRIITLGDRTYLQYVAAAYRHPEDSSPGIGVAWEPYPGRTPFTKDSEAMVAETSAWGRAIVAALAADTKHGVASAEEIKAAQERTGSRRSDGDRSAGTETPRSAPAPQNATQEPDPYGGQWLPQEEEGEGSLVEFGQPATSKQVQRIAIIRKSIPSLQDEDTYRAKLRAAYNVDSAKDLTVAQANRLIKQLEQAATR